MSKKQENPGALPGVIRADVTMPVSKDDILNPTPTTIDLQLHRLLSRYAISADLALVVAEHAFCAGRPS
jgi:hypothetical protein